jgi:nucleoside-triphosphatase
LKPKILITGRPGVGKTTLVQKLLARGGPIAGGFFTEETRLRGRRVGFRVKDVHTGAEGVLSHADAPGGPRVGKYRVDLASFERIGVNALRQALGRPGVVVIDEVGKMELFSKPFQAAVAEVMDSDHPVLATVPVHRHPFLEALRRRSDVELIEITTSNRDELPQRLAAVLGIS